MDSRDTSLPRTAPVQGLVLYAGLALSLLGLLVHSWEYRFFTDDAFIAFRYARNLSEGFGLVFNPGFEALEGFSSPLWVFLLAAMAQLGIEAPNAAMGLSMAATLGLWLGLLRLSWCALPAQCSRYWVLLPVGLLALTRSVCVWSSSGLETRFFECLLMLTLLRFWREGEREPGARRGLPLAGLILGLLAWTRPEGALLCFLIPSVLWCLGPQQRTLALRSLAVALCVLAGLFIWRLSVFGEWLPNTYYAKLDGRTWWSMGAAYVGMFVLEYGLWLWLPLVLLGARSLGRRCLLLQLIIGACLPLLIYTLAIGGDHFEYRPLDLFFPYAYLLLTLGAARLWRVRALRVLLIAWLLLSVLWIWSLPSLSRSNYPTEYSAGFPGLEDSLQARGFPGGAERMLFRLPGSSQLAAWHRQLLQYTSRHFVGLRQEEHKLFLELMSAKGQRLQRLIQAGSLPADLHVAIDCVGAVPYYSDLRVLDRLGLTDRVTAHSPYVRSELSAHGKYATLEHAQRMGVDLWALHPTSLLWDRGAPWFQQQLAASRAQGQEFGLAEIEPGLFLLAWLPMGLAAAQARWPQLRLLSTLD